MYRWVESKTVEDVYLIGFHFFHLSDPSKKYPTFTELHFTLNMNHVVKE